MTNLLRISEAASMALHAMALLAADPERVMTTSELASAFGLSEAHLSKVLQRLSHVGLVHSTRGPRGGFSLTKSPDEITLLDVYEAIEGPIEPTNCLLAKPACAGGCMMGGLLHSVNTLVREQLAGTKLSHATRLIGGLLSTKGGEKHA